MRDGSIGGRVVLAAALAAISAGAGPACAQSTAAGTRVPSVRASEACLSERIRVTGFALPREEGGASLPVEGYRISEILVAEGDTVGLGQELLRAVRPGEAGPGQPAATPFTLRAPLAGRVTRINARVGMMSGQPAAPAPAGQPPEPMVRIMGEAGMDLLVDVPSPYATKLRTGLEARILLDDGEARGTVRVAVSEVDPGTQLGRARLAVEPASALRAGQFASAVIETARGCGLSVPRSAVSYRNGAATVQVLNGSVVETRSVRTGLFDRDTVQIRDGLSAGDPVVADPGAALRPGDRVTPVLPAGQGGGQGAAQGGGQGEGRGR